VNFKNSSNHLINLDDKVTKIKINTNDKHDKIINQNKSCLESQNQSNSISHKNTKTDSCCVVNNPSNCDCTCNEKCNCCNCEDPINLKDTYKNRVSSLVDEIKQRIEMIQQTKQQLKEQKKIRDQTINNVKVQMKMKIKPKSNFTK